MLDMELLVLLIILQVHLAFSLPCYYQSKNTDITQSELIEPTPTTTPRIFPSLMTSNGHVTSTIADGIQANGTAFPGPHLVESTSRPARLAATDRSAPRWPLSLTPSALSTRKPSLTLTLQAVTNAHNAHGPVKTIGRNFSRNLATFGALQSVATDSRPTEQVYWSTVVQTIFTTTTCSDSASNSQQMSSRAPPAAQDPSCCGTPSPSTLPSRNAGESSTPPGFSLVSRRSTTLHSSSRQHSATRPILSSTPPNRSKSASTVSSPGTPDVRSPSNTASSPPSSRVSTFQTSETASLALASSLRPSQSQHATVTMSVVALSPSVVTTLTASGSGASLPFNTTAVPAPITPLAPLTTGTATIRPITSVTVPSAISSNVFASIAIQAPPADIRRRDDHPVPRLSIAPRQGAYQTNKFYANFFLGSQKEASWTHPYSVQWAVDEVVSSGIAVSHVDASQRVYGTGSPAPFFSNPLGVQSLILSALELGANASMTLSSLEAFSVNVSFASAPATNSTVSFPIVQGMGFATAVYDRATPQLGSSVYFRSLTYVGSIVDSETVRYEVTLNDGNNWMIYMTPYVGHSAPTLKLVSAQQIVGNAAFSGSLQVGKSTSISAEGLEAYDRAAGAWPESCFISASTQGAIGSYTFTWSKGGNASRDLFMWALPHHIGSLASLGAPSVIPSLQLQTTTKGVATAVLGNSWTLTETDLPWDMDFAPWSPSLRSQRNVSAAVQTLLAEVATVELGEDIIAQTNVDSMYYAGKALAKFAFATYAANDMANAGGVASAALLKLKDAFNVFVNDTQIDRLVYDSSWGGVVSSAGYTDASADFGNTYYNDHHFHYGYFVYTAAVIAYLDPSWLTADGGANRAWVEMLVRDYANPSTSDPYFPFSRMFDWWHGHSWAHGLFESADGKDEESSSEDAFASYALKMWGRAAGDASTEARGNLMLAVTARSLNNYFLLQSDNKVQPPAFVPNKADGILFENKVAHTTYFGANDSFVEGIHMLPLNPSSTLTRDIAFVREEWDMYFSDGRVDQVQGGWKGILYANLAIIDPARAYVFFADPGFQYEWLDGGASRTWYLAFCAGLGGAGA